VFWLFLRLLGKAKYLKGSVAKGANSIIEEKQACKILSGLPVDEFLLQINQQLII